MHKHGHGIWTIVFSMQWSWYFCHGRAQADSSVQLNLLPLVQSYLPMLATRNRHHPALHAPQVTAQPRFSHCTRPGVLLHSLLKQQISCNPCLTTTHDIIYVARFSCQKAMCALQTSCSEMLPQFYPSMDSPDPSKTQSTVGTMISFYTGPRQPGPHTYTLSSPKH